MGAIDSANGRPVARNSLPSIGLALALAVGGCAEPSASADTTRQPANADEVIAFCKTVLCRDPGTVRLTDDQGKPFETTFELPVPIVQNDWVSIFPGEIIYVEAETGAGRLVKLKAVAANDHPGRTLEFRMWQEAGSPGTFLSVRNPFPKTIKYHAAMMLPASDRLRKTTSCPVLSDGRMAFEMWPHAIFQLVLSDFRVIEDTQRLPCDY